MRTFKDNEGRTWAVSVNTTAIKNVRASLGIDLLEVADGKIIDRLTSDPVMLVDLLYVLCRDEAESRGISDSQFGRAMAGDCIDAAMHALFEELVDFFPREGVRKAVRTAWTKIRRLQTVATETATARLEAVDAEAKVRDAVNATIDRHLSSLGISSGSVLAS